MASPTWEVVAPPPMSRVRMAPERRVSSTARSTRAPSSGSPMFSSSSPPERMVAMGLMTFWPLYLGAEPWMGSNMETPWGLRFAPAAKPRPPVMAAPRSVMMSPIRLGKTTTP